MGKLCTSCKERPAALNRYYCLPCRTEKERQRWNSWPQERRRAKWLKSKYKLSYDEYKQMYDDQEGQCAICSIPISITSKMNEHQTACVDHCHETNKIRGLLCNHCNRSLGLMKESVPNLIKMIDYLRGS